MNHLETGVATADSTARAAIPAPIGPASNAGLVWNGSSWVAAALVNANIDAAAAIAYTKLALAGSIINNDVSVSAAIAYSKLNLGSSILSSDIVDGTIVNTDISASAAIAASKLAIPLVTTSTFAGGPPGSPNDKDVWIATAVDANGTRWQFQYNASSGTNKWEGVGNTPIVVRATGTRPSAAYSTPRAGRWRVVWAGSASVSSGGDAAVTASNGDAAASGGNFANGAGSFDSGDITAASSLSVSTAGVNWTGGFATISVVPVRIT